MLLRWLALALSLPCHHCLRSAPASDSEIVEPWWGDWEKPARNESRRAPQDGGGPQHWVVKRELGRRAYFDVHIPKTAGTSWARTVHKVMPKGEGYHTREDCFYNEDSRQPGDAVVVFLRQPAAHVYSQFLTCKYSRFGRQAVRNADKDKLDNVTMWLKHFQAGKMRDDLNCYHPFNMQTRALSCSSGEKYASHHYSNFTEPSLDMAKESLQKAFFVGITEHYQASACLFFAKTQPEEEPLPKYCDCKNETAWGHFARWDFKVNHDVPAHSLEDLSHADMKLVMELTRLDRQLYQTAWLRFQQEAAEVKKTRGVQILCFQHGSHS